MAVLRSSATPLAWLTDPRTGHIRYLPGGLEQQPRGYPRGAVLRRSRVERVSSLELTEAYAILRQFREQFQYPLTKANMGLRSCVRTVTRQKPTVAQRLKQPPRIIDKLCRKPTMRLSQMEDVGGCRAILPSLTTVYKVADRVRLTGHVLYEDDANNTERPTGYRALHIVTDYDGRRIEMQLRTTRQHEWAEHVEELDDMLGTHLKDGDGPEELLEYLKTLSDGFAQIDRRGKVDVAWETRYTPVRQLAEEYLTRVRGDGGR